MKGDVQKKEEEGGEEQKGGLRFRKVVVPCCHGVGLKKGLAMQRGGEVRERVGEGKTGPSFSGNAITWPTGS